MRPMWRSSCISCCLHLHSVSDLGLSDAACDSSFENGFHMQTNKQDSDPLYENFVLIFCSLQALTFNLCSGFSCPTFFSLIFFNPHLLHFLRGCERMLWSSSFFNCFRIICGRFQAISIFVWNTVNSSDHKHVLVLIPQATWIVQLIWWICMFYASPLRLQSSPVYVFVVVAISKVKIQMIHQVNPGNGQHAPGISSVLLNSGLYVFSFATPCFSSSQFSILQLSVNKVNTEVWWNYFKNYIILF